MCPINIVNKKIHFQSIFLFLLTNFIMAATTLNIPQRFFNFSAFLFHCSKKDPFWHSTVWSFILSSGNLKHVLSHNQSVVFIKYKLSAGQQKGQSHTTAWWKNRERKNKITICTLFLWTGNTEWLECLLYLTKWHTGIPILSLYTRMHSMKTDSTSTNMSCYQHAASFSFKTCTDVCIDTT